MPKLIDLTGYASVTEQPYDMWDMFGVYTEIVDAGAFVRTVAASPLVVFRVNHAGNPMAATWNDTLKLWSDDTGLGFTAQVDPARSDVADLLAGIERGEIRETSMAGTFKGRWSPDYTEFRVTEVDLDRGDVAAVTFGANPHGRVQQKRASVSDDVERMTLTLALAAA